MNPPFEPQILGLLCNWCCYAGADLAGVSRFQYPPNIRIIRVMCSGRVDALFVLDAFSKGIDGVLVGGCHPGDCHYGMGNYEAVHMMNMTQKLLEYIGVDPHRLCLVWVSAAEGARFAQIVTEFTERIRTLGPLTLAQEEEELGGLQLRLDAAKIAAGGEKLRWMVGKSTEFLREGNRYGEVFTQHELNRAMERIIADEVAVEGILLLLRQEPLSVREISQRLELPPPRVLRYISALRRKDLVHLDGIRGSSPLYRTVKQTDTRRNNTLHAQRSTRKGEQSAMGKSALVVGRGLASVEEALVQAQTGNKVYLLVDSPAISSQLSAISHPQLDNIHLITHADLEEVEEKNGQFKVRLRRRAPRIIAEKCDDCRACIKVCPISLGDERNQGMSLRTAIDFFHDAPPTYSIIRETPPCQDTCPVHLDVRGYVSLIADGRFVEALALIRERLPFPAVCGRICPHPCEEKCNRGIQDEPVAIKHLKRFVADYEMNYEACGVERNSREVGSGKREAYSVATHSLHAPRSMLNTPRGEVAIIGAGPAGLTAAHDLARLGHGVTVLESLPIAGGMLYVGIPDYRLPKGVLRWEIDRVRDLGVEIKTDTKVGEDVTIDGLFKQGYKAVFIAVGAHRSRRLGIPGEEAGGVLHAIAFLRDMNLGRDVEVGEKVAVVGGGNAAMDAARSALRLGAKKVFIAYRRSRREMPASDEEIEAALAEGIEMEFLTAPIEIITSDARVAGMRCTRMALGEPDASGRRRPIPIPGSEFDIEVDMVIAAIGQAPDLSVLNGSSGIEISGRGFLAIDPYTLATTRAGVYAGGDCVQPGIAIEAIASGKRGALSIHRYLSRR